MCGRNAWVGGACALICAVGAPVASGATFSFASDNNNNAFTFRGAAGTGGAFTLTDGAGAGRVPVEFFVGAQSMPTIALMTEFDFSASLQYAGSVDLGGGVFIHSYRGEGSFRFFEQGTGNLLLTCSVDTGDAVMTTQGGVNTWSTSGAVFGSDTAGAVTYNATPALVNALAASGVNPSSYGIQPGPSSGPDDFSFSMTSIMANGVPGVNLFPDVPSNPNRRLPSTAFDSEGSFSGTTGPFIPTPSTLVLAGAGFIVAMSRRRR